MRFAAGGGLARERAAAAETWPLPDETTTMRMLHSHMAARASVLLATAKIPAASGHPLHKGTPHEAFIKEFLEDHLAESLAIGQGEVISADSVAGEPRNQFDIVLYKRTFPRLAYGGGINAFLVESVVATIEVKSTLDKEGLRQAVKAAGCVPSLVEKRCGAPLLPTG